MEIVEKLSICAARRGDVARRRTRRLVLSLLTIAAVAWSQPLDTESKTMFAKSVGQSDEQVVRACGDGHRIDQMAVEGVRFSRAFVPFPVCSACRSSIALGANAIRFGAHEHRSRRGPDKTYLPEGMKTIAELMREAYYFTFNVGKTDYNFAEAGDGIYSPISKQNTQTPWRECPPGQPFFGQIQLKGGKSNTTKFPQAKKTDPATVTVPADYPQNDLYREVVAQHYDTIRSEDAVIGGILDRIEADGMLKTTIVVYFSDHGANHLIRHKQMPTEGGLHVPFIIQGPKNQRPIAGP